MRQSLVHIPSGKPSVSDTERRPGPWRWVIGVMLMALLVSVGAYFASSHAGDLAKVEKMREELFTQETRKLSEEERRARFEAFRSEMAKLDNSQRSSFMDSGMAKAREKYDSYFKLSPAEKVKQLDADIARSEQARKAWEARRAADGTTPANSPASSQANTGPGGPPKSVSPMSVAGGPNAQRPGGERGQNRSPQEMENRRKQFLDHTTPKQRAAMDQMRELSSKYREDLNKRRKQLGLPEMTGRGFGGGPGGPGFGGPRG